MAVIEALALRYNRWSRILLDRTVRHNLVAIQRRIARQPKILPALDALEPCIFTLSTGRVGTQTLSALGGLSKNLLAYHEPTPYLYGLSKLAYQNSEDRDAEKILHESIYAARYEVLTYSTSCEQGYLETSPQATFLAPMIHNLFPRAKFVHLIREPREVVRSGMRRNWYAGVKADSTRIEPRVGSAYFEAWSNYTPLQKNIWLWAETNRWINDFCSGLPPEQTLLIKAEDIFSGNAESLQQFYDFVEGPLPHHQKLENIRSKQLNRQLEGEFADSDYQKNVIGNELFTFANDVAQAFQYHL